VLVSEVNPFRISLLKEFGIEVVNPADTDLVALVEAQTGGVGADVVFEVTGSKS
jgi:threonine dehydrogenase-like Zn-dependent dehydrogenase